MFDNVLTDDSEVPQPVAQYLVGRTGNKHGADARPSVSTERPFIFEAKECAAS